MTPDELRERLLDAMRRTPDAYQLVASHCARTFGWTCSQHAAVAIVSKWLSPRDPHRLPAEALPIIVGVTGCSEILLDLLREARHIKARPKRQPARVRPAEETPARKRA